MDGDPGRSRLGGLVLGSTAEAVVRHSDRPMVLVGPLARPDPPAGPVVVCVDGSTLPTAMLPTARWWAERLQCPLRLVMVAGDGSPAGEEAAAFIDSVSEQLAVAGHAVDAEILSGGSPAEAIERYAERESAALLAMATHARAGLRRAVLGSVTMTVVHRAPCPLLVQVVQQTAP